MKRPAEVAFRSLLFAPAVRQDLVGKMQSSGADAVVIDCEDGTPADRKAEVRANASELVTTARGGSARLFLRVNAVDSEWFAADLELVSSLVDVGVVVPKVETLAQLDSLRELAGVAVIVGLETVRAVADARILLEHPVVDAAYFGAEDYIADLGGRRTASNHEVATARSLVSMAGRLEEVPVFDQIVSQFHDADRFVREAQEARDLGYAGKLCIHPSQVANSNAVFTPTAEEVSSARAIVAAYEQATAAGVSVLDIDGQMIDGPLVSQARRVLDLAANYGDD